MPVEKTLMDEDGVLLNSDSFLMGVIELFITLFSYYNCSNITYNL